MSLKIFSVLALSSLLATSAFAQSNFVTRLNGLNETPIVISRGTGNVRLSISDDAKSIEYELTYSGIEGGKVLFAHVHVGRPTIAGGVAVFFCGGGNSDKTKAACPDSGTLTGTWTAADIVGPASQGVDPTDTNENAWERFVKAIRAGLSYANVHSVRSPGGEIRGQLMPGRDRDRE
ncbi:MAG: CHRD domain-containing protein [Acidobacteria bacterium]|nr:CHRD domain-containing protein [Acidobacteriota bacterium]